MEATLLRAALPSIPVVNQLPGIRKTGGDLTSLHEVRTAVLEPERVRAYAEVCGFPVRDTVPLTFPHVLAFPLHMAILSSPTFPFPAIGTVHLANRVTSRRPLEVGETLEIGVRARPPAAHPKGTTVDFLATATVADEAVWDSTSTYLRRGRRAEVAAGPAEGGAQGGAESAADGPSHGRVVPGRVSWRLAGDLGRRYAAVSGDHNPIHLYPLTARALGFPRQIAHGMWSLARCVAALESRLPDAVTVEASFRKPILLPGTVAFGQDPTPDGIAFALTSPGSGAAHLVGRTHPA